MASLPTPYGRPLFAPIEHPARRTAPPAMAPPAMAPPAMAPLAMAPPMAPMALPVLAPVARKRSARRRSARKSVRRTLKLRSSGRFSQYVVRGKGSSRRKVSIKRKACSPQARKVYEGPKGGHYCMKNGRKHYIKI